MSKNVINKTINFKVIQDVKNFDNKQKDYVSTIDYNYPSLNRKDLSDLTNINNKEHQFKKLNTNRDWSLNLYNLDIEGSSPRKFGYFFNKEDFINKNSDIEKSSPKNYNQNINKKSFNLTNDDIEFSKPQCVKNTTTRHTNPLQPKYIMKNPEILPITPSKFIRDAMDINDIKGSRPKKIGNDKNLFKEPILKDVIQDSWPRNPFKVRKSKYEYLDYRDVTNIYKNFRNTNPLRPIYNWSYVDNSKSFGPIDGNYPLVYSKYLYKTPFNLNNKDIEGANTGSKNRYLKFNGTNYSYNTKDIRGAQSNTVARGIITSRHTNPVSPKYQYLGHSEIPNIENNPYHTGFKSTGHYDKNNINKKININNNNNNIQSVKKEYNVINDINSQQIGNNNTINNRNEELFNTNRMLLQDNENKNIQKINENNCNNKILEKNIKIIDNENDNKDIKNDYKVSLRNDGKTDFGNNYKKPEEFYGLSHYNYLLPSDLNKNQTKLNNFGKLKIPNNPIKKEMKRRSASTYSKEDNNYCSKLDEFINSRNLQCVESQKNIKENNAVTPNLINENNNRENNNIEEVNS